MKRLRPVHPGDVLVRDSCDHSNSQRAGLRNPPAYRRPLSIKSPEGVSP
jgi:hypothetical protein